MSDYSLSWRVIGRNTISLAAVHLNQPIYEVCDDRLLHLQRKRELFRSNWAFTKKMNLEK